MVLISLVSMLALPVEVSGAPRGSYQRVLHLLYPRVLRQGLCLYQQQSCREDGRLYRRRRR